MKINVTSFFDFHQEVTISCMMEGAKKIQFLLHSLNRML